MEDLLVSLDLWIFLHKAQDLYRYNNNLQVAVDYWRKMWQPCKSVNMLFQFVTRSQRSIFQGRCRMRFRRTSRQVIIWNQNAKTSIVSNMRLLIFTRCHRLLNNALKQSVLTASCRRSLKRISSKLIFSTNLIITVIVVLGIRTITGSRMIIPGSSCRTCASTIVKRIWGIRAPLMTCKSKSTCRQPKVSINCQLRVDRYLLMLRPACTL